MLSTVLTPNKFTFPHLDRVLISLRSVHSYYRLLHCDSRCTRILSSSRQHEFDGDSNNSCSEAASGHQSRSINAHPGHVTIRHTANVGKCPDALYICILHIRRRCRSTLGRSPPSTMLPRRQQLYFGVDGVRRRHAPVGHVLRPVQWWGRHLYIRRWPGPLPLCQWFPWHLPSRRHQVRGLHWLVWTEWRWWHARQGQDL